MIKTKTASVLTLAMLFLAGMASTQSDPGVQHRNRGTGATLIDPKNDPNGFFAFFQDGRTRFLNARRISGPHVGLGPRFNSDNCSSCHTQPQFGGTGGSINLQFFFPHSAAPGNTLPYFITEHSPTVIARFPFFFNPDGTVNYNAPNGGVEDMFTITGLGCRRLQ